MTISANVEKAYELAVERYASVGVDVPAALETLRTVAISVHCWQGDDVAGFEGSDAEFGSGLAVTGNYPGRARTADELRSDLELAYSLIPGKHRLNLHALYGEFAWAGRSRRDRRRALSKAGSIGPPNKASASISIRVTFRIDKAADGFTLAHA